jgi:hypothetical protein
MSEFERKGAAAIDKRPLQSKSKYAKTNQTPIQKMCKRGFDLISPFGFRLRKSLHDEPDGGSQKYYKLM